MTKHFMSRLSFSLLLFIAAILWVNGCGDTDTVDAEDGAVDRIVVTVWMHTGQEFERKVIEDQAKRFNAQQDEITVDVKKIMETDYEKQVSSAAQAGKLPDLLDFDGPFLYNYVWEGHLVPIDNLLPEATKMDLLPSIIKQGTYNGKLYSVGTFDSGLCLYANKAKLKAVKARIPSSIDDAWTIKEFNKILTDLAAKDDDRQVLDLKVNYKGEWYSYAFGPILQSANGDLIDRNTYRKSDSVLNGPESVGAMKHVQQWFKKGFVDPNTDDRSFVDGRVALSWSGHWDYNNYAKNLKDDLLLLPLPNFGKGSRTGMGSWNWGITKKAKNPKAAMKFLEFILQPEEILKMTDANGAVPSRKSAIRQSERFGEGGKLNLFIRQLEKSAVPRPATPAYLVIRNEFQKAFHDIRDGADVRKTLDRAVQEIDRDIADRGGYQPRE